MHIGVLTNTQAVALFVIPADLAIRTACILYEVAWSLTVSFNAGFTDQTTGTTFRHLGIAKL